MADGEGVVFVRKDCAGLIRRMLIILADGAALGAARAVFGAAGGGALSWAWWGFLFGYLVVLESRSATLGCLLAGVRVVDLQGRRPSLLRMAMRLLPWVAGPVHPLVDFLWLGGDDQGQTLRDKFTGIRVVRKRAEAVGRGPVRLNYFTLLGYSFVFFEVERPASAAL
jgi:uncharacterized RDD family membrane protein YckC